MSVRMWRHVANEITRYMPNLTITTLFDIGANVGQSATAMAEVFPDAEIWTFEPVAMSYAELEQAVSGLERVHPVRAALGRRTERGFVRAAGTSVTNALVSEQNPRAEEVEILAGDDFCAEHGVDHIGYVKIDTEGHDLEVLRGFHEMLGRYQLDLVEVEVAMNPNNTRHVRLERVTGYLEPIGYSIFRLFEQQAEYRRIDGVREDMPNLRRANAVFVSNEVIEANPRPRPPRPPGSGNQSR